jgi:hypothetical protein
VRDDGDDWLKTLVGTLEVGRLVESDRMQVATVAYVDQMIRARQLQDYR